MFSPDSKDTSANRGRGGRRNDQFTPVGGIADTRVFLDRSAAARTERATGSPIGRNNKGRALFGSSSSFTSLENTPNGTHIYSGVNILPPSDSEDGESPRRRDATLENNGLISDGGKLMRQEAATIGSMRKENISLKVTLSLLRKELADVPEDKRELVERNVSLGRENAALHARLDELEENGLASQNERLELQLRQLEDELDRAREEKQLLEQREADMADELSELKLEAQQHEAELQRVREEQQQQGALDEKDDQINALQTELDRAEQRAAATEDQNDILQRRYDSLKQDFEDLESRAKEAERISLENENNNNNSTTSRYEEEAERWKKRFDELKAQNDTLQVEITQLRHDNRRTVHTKEKTTTMLQDLVDELVNAANKSEAEKAKMRETIETLQQSEDENPLVILEDLQHDREALDESLAAANKRIEDLEDELHDATARAASAESAKASAISAAAAAAAAATTAPSPTPVYKEPVRESFDSSRLNQLQRSNAELRSANKSLSKECSELRESKRLLVADYQKLQAAYDRGQSDYGALKVNSDDYANDLVKLTEQNRSLQRDLELAQQDIADLQRAASQYSSNSTFLERDLTQLQRDNDRLSRENSNLSSQLASLQSEKSRLQAQISSSVPDDAELRKLRSKLNDAIDDNGKLEKKLDKKENELKRMKEELADANSEKRDLKASIKELNRAQQRVIDRNNELTRDLKSVQESVGGDRAQLQEKLSKKKTELRELASDYNEMKNDLLSQLETYTKQQNKTELEVAELKEEIERLHEREEVYLSMQKESQQQQQRQAAQYPPTPTTPRSTPPAQDSRVELLESQRELYRAKLQQLKDTNSDLRFANEYLRKRVKGQGDVIERNVQKLNGAAADAAGAGGIENQARPRTFAGVACAALAAVRMNKRMQEAERRRLAESKARKVITHQSVYSN